MSILEDEARMKVLSCSNSPLRSTGPSYHEVTDRVLSECQTGFQGQYVQSLMRDENDCLEDEFCSLNSSPDTTQNSLEEEERPESIQANVTENEQNLASLILLNDEETVESISSLESVASCEFPEQRALSPKSTDISGEIDFKKKGRKFESRLTEKVKPHPIIKRKAKESADLEILANSFEEPGEMSGEDNNKKCDCCKKMFGQYEWKKFKRHKKIQHTVSCSHCELKFVDEWDLNKHSRKFHKVATKYDCEVRYDYECRKCLKKSRSLENIVKHERLKHPYQCQVCLEEKVDHPLSFIDKNGLKCHTKAMHNVETGANNFKNSDLDGDSNEDFGDCILEGDSNKNDDDLQVVAVVPKIIKGTTRFIIDKDLGIIKKKKRIRIKEEPEMLELNENCWSQETTDQDDVCNREVDYSTRIINEAVQDQNNLGKVQSNVRMTTNNNLEFVKSESLVDKTLNISNDEVNPFTGEVRQRYQVPLSVAEGLVAGNSGPNGKVNPVAGNSGPNGKVNPVAGNSGPNGEVNPVAGNSGPNGKVNYWSSLDPMSPTCLISSGPTDQAIKLPVRTQPLTEEKTLPILGSRMTAAAKSGMETPNPSSLGSERTTPSMGSMSRGLHPAVALGPSEVKKHDDISGISKTQPMTKRGREGLRVRMTRPLTTRGMGGLRMRGATGVRFTRGAPGVPSTRGAPCVSSTRGAMRKPFTRGAPGSSTWGAPGVPSARGAPGVPATRGAPGVPSTRGAPGVPATREPLEVPFTNIAPGVPSTRGAPGVPSTRGAPLVPFSNRAPGVPFRNRAPGVPSSNRAPGVPSTNRAPGVPFTQRAPGVPCIGGAPTVPSTRGSPDVPSSKGMSLTSRKPMLRNEFTGQISSRRGLKTRGGSRVGLETRGRSGEPPARENSPIIPTSSGISGIRNVKLSKDGGGLPRRPVLPGMSTADLHYSQKTKNVEVELIELSDDDSSPATPANPALERLRNCGISVTSLKSSTKPECLQVPPGISMSPVATAYSFNEPRNGESREKASNVSNKNRPAKEQDTSIEARSATPPLQDEIKVNVNNLSPEQKKKLQCLGLL